MSFSIASADIVPPLLITNIPRFDRTASGIGQYSPSGTLLSNLESVCFQLQHNDLGQVRALRRFEPMPPRCRMVFDKGGIEHFVDNVPRIGDWWLLQLADKLNHRRQQ